jgi:hypothetical protein
VRTPGDQFGAEEGRAVIDHWVGSAGELVVTIGGVILMMTGAGWAPITVGLSVIVLAYITRYWRRQAVKWELAYRQARDLGGLPVVNGAGVVIPPDDDVL